MDCIGRYDEILNIFFVIKPLFAAAIPYKSDIYSNIAKMQTIHMA